MPFGMAALVAMQTCKKAVKPTTMRCAHICAGTFSWQVFLRNHAVKPSTRPLRPGTIQAGTKLCPAGSETIGKEEGEE